MTGLERLGFVLGCIPVVSTIAGLIKGFIYLHKAKLCEKKLKAMEATSNVVDDMCKKVLLGKPDGFGLRELQNPVENQFQLYKKISNDSFIQMIPIFGNIMGGIEEYEHFEALEEAQQMEIPEQQYEQLAKVNSFELPNKETEKQKRDYLQKLLFTCHNLNLPTNFMRDLYSECFVQFDNIKEKNVLLVVKEKLDNFDMPVFTLAEPEKPKPGMIANMHAINNYQSAKSRFDASVENIENAKTKLNELLLKAKVDGV
jgi:hypothetical protein